MTEKEKSVAKIIYEALAEDVVHKRLGIVVRDMAFSTTAPHPHPRIELNTDDAEITLFVEVNDKS